MVVVAATKGEDKTVGSTGYEAAVEMNAVLLPLQR